MFIETVTARGFRAGVETDLSCTFPGRFALLVGGNSAGKTTICEALYLAHRHRFPQLPRPSAVALRRGADGPRELSIACAFEPDATAEGPLGRQRLSDGVPSPSWTRELSRSLGRIRVQSSEDTSEQMRVVYLPAHRNPVDELARRDADVLVELLRSEQQRQAGHRSLYSLRHRAQELLGQLVAHDLVQTLEDRVQDVMTQLSGGVARQWPYVGGQVVDDQFLARVLELLLAPQVDRSLGERLEVSGLGYVNLLHIAVTLAAIPDLEVPVAAGADAGWPPDAEVPEPDAAAAQAEVDEADERAAADEDSFFQGLFHATVVIEEPEAHLHPQLQHGLVRHLRRVIEQRPELQVVVSSHAPDLIASVRPEDVVVVRRTAQGRRTFALAKLPGPAAKAKGALRMAALHLDASRSASLFAERLVLVEGVTDALILRQLGRHWASSDVTRRQFIDALTIVPIGCKVGEWPVRLLATPGFELVTRLAVLTDSDNRTLPVPNTPQWFRAYDPGVVVYRMNHPTLEPALAVPGNEVILADALAAAEIEVPAVVDRDTMDALFRSKTADQPAGRGAKRKGEFAYSLAAELADAEFGTVSVPEHIMDVLAFVFEGVESPAAAGEVEVPVVDREGA